MASCCSSRSDRRCRSSRSASSEGRRRLRSRTIGRPRQPDGALLTRGTAKRTGVRLDRPAIEFVGGSLETAAGRDGLTVSLAVPEARLSAGTRSAGRGRALADVPGGGAHAKGRADPGGHQALGRGSGYPVAPARCPGWSTRTTRTASRSRAPDRIGRRLTRDDVVRSTGGTCVPTPRSSRSSARSRSTRRAARCWRASALDAALDAPPPSVRRRQRTDAGRGDADQARSVPGDDHARSAAFDRSIRTTSRSPSPPTCSAAARPRGSTRACATKAGSRTRSTATCRPPGTRRRSSWRRRRGSARCRR